MLYASDGGTVLYFNMSSTSDRENAPFNVVVPRQQEGDHPAEAGTRCPPDDPQLRILHHTRGRYLVVEKPADIRMDGAFINTVEKLTMRYLRKMDDTTVEGFAPRFVQRLDYATSGVLLIALGRAAAGVAAAQFERRQVHKEYIALVHGHIREGSLSQPIIIDAPIADGLPKGSYHMVIGDNKNPGRPSRTICIPIKHGEYHGAPITKVRLLPESGRRHQLRVHLAYRQWPIVGDATYAEKEDYAAFHSFIPPRMMLHAKRLEVRLAVDELFGRKSALRTAKLFKFDTGDPFDQGMDGLVWGEIVNEIDTA